MVERCEKPQGIRHVAGNIDARIQPHAAIDTAVVVGQQAGREAPSFPLDVVLYVDADVRTPVFVFVTRMMVDAVGVDGTTQTCAEDVLAAIFDAYGRLSKRPLCPCVEVSAIDRREVVVLVGRRLVAQPDVVVGRAVPIHLRQEVDATLQFALKRKEVTCVGLVLRVAARAVERIGAISHVAHSCLEIKIETL